MAVSISLLSTFLLRYSLLLEFCVVDFEGAPEVDDVISTLVQVFFNITFFTLDPMSVSPFTTFASLQEKLDRAAPSAGLSAIPTRWGG